MGVMTSTGWRSVPHTADLALEIWAPDLERIYATAATALFESLGEPRTLEPDVPFEVASAGVDREDLLVRLLSDLLAAFEVDGRFVLSATCEALDPGADGVDAAVTLRCEGGRVDRDREPGLQEIKAVTYHALQIREENDRIVARVVFDL